VRELHVSKLRGLTLIIPAWLLAPVMSLGGLREGTDRLKPTEEMLREAPTLAVPDAAPDQAGHPLATPDTLDQFRRFPRLGRVRDEVLSLVTRSSSSDVATGICVASSSGGGRIATVATVIGFCVSSLGAGALCVATGVVKTPGWMFHREVRPTSPRPTPPTRRTAPRSVDTKPARFVAPTPTPRPISPLPRAATRSKQRRSASQDPSQGTTETSHESAPIADTSRASAPDFAFENPYTPESNPDPAPATGGGEFSP
jgi:hypothetical protein